jgi:predicted nucleotidyltransferase
LCQGCWAGGPQQENFKWKIKMTADEIARKIMEAASKLPEYEGLTGVTIRPVDDERVDYNWEVSIAHNSPGRLCEVAIATIVDGAQRVNDLKL